MGFWHGLLLLTFVHLLAAASPGPDFALVTRQSLVHGRRAGLLTSLGVALGLAVHIAYSAAGLAAIIVRSHVLTVVVKICGAAFLLYLGFAALRSVPRSAPRKDEFESATSAASSVKSGFVAGGFLCNLFNPKAPLYFLALFTAVLPRDLPKTTLAIYGAWLVVLQWSWFAIVAMLFTHPQVRASLMSARVWIDRVFGIAMVAIALRLLWSLYTTD
jgi:RhtB (resistance to homoserine/threonine) family protein